MTELPIQRLLLEALSILERLNIPYAIMGGFAVRSWGIPRPTYDADIAITLDQEDLMKMFKAFEAEGFDVPQEYQKGFHDTLAGMGKVKVTRFEGRSVWDVDLFLAQDGLLASALKRRRSRSLGGRPVWVMSPEDVIVLKLVAYRRKDQLDVEEIFKLSHDLDLDYLKKWTSQLDVSDRLQTFLQEFPPTSSKE